MKTIYGSACAAALLLPAAAHANWPNAFGTEENNAVMPIAATVTNVAAGSSLVFGNEDVAGGPPITVLNDTFFAVAMQGEEFGSTVTDRLWIKAFNRNTGALEWESPDLDPQASVNDNSKSAPVIDTAAQKLFYGSGQTMVRLDAGTGAIDWATSITAGNTGPGRSYEFVNSSPALGGGRVFIQTRDYLASSSQVVAFDAATGAIEWSVLTGGLGLSKPIYSDTGTSQVVYALTGTAASGRMVCLDAATGAVEWDSATAPVPWTLPAGFQFWGEAVLHGGNLYAPGYDFSTSAPLVCVDADDGSLVWQTMAEGTDTPPLIVGGNLLLRGGDFFSFQVFVTGYDPATGAVTIPTAVIPGFTFRNAMAATNDRVYLCNTSNLLVLDASDLSLLGASPAGFMDGAVSLDSTGAVYAVDYDSGSPDNKRPARFAPPAAMVADWSEY